LIRTFLFPDQKITKNDNIEQSSDKSEPTRVEDGLFDFLNFNLKHFPIIFGQTLGNNYLTFPNEGRYTSLDLIDLVTLENCQRNQKIEILETNNSNIPVKLQSYSYYRVNNVNILNKKLEIISEELPIKMEEPHPFLQTYINKHVKIGLVYNKKVIEESDLDILNQNDPRLYEFYHQMIELLDSQDHYVLWFNIDFTKLSDLNKIIGAIKNKVNYVCSDCSNSQKYCIDCAKCHLFKALGDISLKEYVVLIRDDKDENNNTPKQDLKNHLIDITKLDEFEMRIDWLTVNPCFVTNPYFGIKKFLMKYGRHMMKKPEGILWVKEYKQVDYTKSDMNKVINFAENHLTDNFYYEISGLCELYQLYLEIRLHLVH